MYTLYYNPGTASMCVHQALIEANAPYRLVLTDLQAGQQRDPAYLKLNPNGVVPTLLIEGVPFTEAAALLMTVATRHPGAGLAPMENSSSRAAWYQWIVYLTNTPQAAFRLWFYPTDISDDANTQAILKEALRKRIESVWARIDAHLAALGPYLLGAKFSAAGSDASHAHPLVAKHAQARDRVGSAESVRRANENSTELEAAFRARRFDRVGLK
jgi:glutathione S-transferase